MTPPHATSLAAAAPAAFSQSYAEARRKFRAAATHAGIDVASHLHPRTGRDAEPLAMDVARAGPADARALLLVSSACHGVEGFCGSAVQTALLRDAAWRAAAARAGVAVLFVHALNPFGFSWWCRTTHENIDLNRNFRDFTAPLQRNAGYDALATALVPPQWPPSAEAAERLAGYEREHGFDAWQRAVTGGQHDHPDGLFYGGRAPSWSNLTLRRVLREHARHCARLGWIDIHTGLGPPGVGERIFACRDDAAALRRARAWWGDGVTSLFDGSSSSAPLDGLMWLAAYEECAQAEYTGIALEFGTLPIRAMIDALRARQWLDTHREAPAALRLRIERQTRDAFYIDTDAWKRQVIAQSLDAAHAAVRGLGGH